MAFRYTWGQLAQQFVNAIAAEELGTSNKWQHMTSGHRRLLSLVNLPEDDLDFNVETVPGQDWVTLEEGTKLIYTVVDLSTGRPVRREESIRQRNKHIETTGMPVVGDIHRWLRQRDRLLLRDTPKAVVTLRISHWLQVGLLSNDDEEEYPVSPPQFDDAILRLALANYFELEGADPQRAGAAISAAQAQLAMEPSPKKEEGKDTIRALRIQGYRMTPRSF